MKLKLQRSIPITNKHVQSFLIGHICEAETAKANGFYVDTLDTGEYFIDYTDAGITLENLNKLTNDIELARINTNYKTQNLEWLQINAILDNLGGMIPKAIKHANPNFSAKTASIIFGKAWERGHSSGYSEVICAAFDFIDFANEILDSVKEKQ